VTLDNLVDLLSSSVALITNCRVKLDNRQMDVAYFVKFIIPNTILAIPVIALAIPIISPVVNGFFSRFNGT